MSLLDRSASLRVVSFVTVALGVSAAAAQPAPRLDAHSERYMDAIRDAVRLRAPAFRRCFEQALRRDPTLTTRSEALRFRVLPTGRVQVIDVRVTPRAPTIERCMTGVLERMVLPPHAGASIEVSYPLG